MREIIHTDLRNKRYLEWLQFLKNSENWSKEQIDDYQFAQIKEIINLAYQNTRGYRELYLNSGITPETIKTIDDIHKVPFVERETIRDNLNDFHIPTRWEQYITTGGSTGIPFGMYRDRIAFAKELASKAYQYYRIGWKEGDRQLVFRGLPIKSRKHIVFYPRFNELRCSSYHFTPEIMESYRKKAFEYKPDWIRCYPSSGYIFARFIKENKLAFPPLKGILCASENLYSFQKDLLHETFGCRVFSHYGHYEMAALAGFCEHQDTYHVLPQYGYTELIGKDGKLVTKPGEIGEIITTSFIMRAVPFIRYRTSDLAVLQGWGCPNCGRPYQIWSSVEGRLQEFIITGSGRYISMTAINMHDNIFDHIKQFQFFQEEKGKLCFRFIPRETCNYSVVQDIKSRLMVKFGDDIDLKMEPVADIPLTKRGKHRFLIQRLTIEYGDI